MAQQSKRALFIGNSYTYYNSLPAMVDSIARSFGDTLYSESSTPGGYTFQSHTTNANTQAKLKAGGWDVVILQEQSQRPSFPPSQVAMDVYPYAKMLVDTARAYSSCVTPMFYLTWGRENGDASNCPNYPPLCTYAGMQARLRTSYLEMAQLNNAEVAPVGAVWREIRDSTNIDLYASDGSHPSMSGSYLAACTFYASIFHKSPIGGWSPSSLTTQEIADIQKQAAQTVFDSVATWQIDTVVPIQDFNVALYLVGNTHCKYIFDFSGSMYADSIYVDYGNGYTSSEFVDTVNYYTYNQFDIISELYRGCDMVRTIDYFDTFDCVNGISENSLHIEVYPNPAGDYVIVRTENINLDGAVVELINVAGQTVIAQPWNGNRIDVGELAPGVYYLQLKSAVNVYSATVVVE